MTRLTRPFLCLALEALVAGCAAPAHDRPATAVASGTASACDDAGFLALVARHPTGYTEVTVCGTVARVLPARRTRSGEHGYFYVTVAPGALIEIVTNLDETTPFDVHPGDRAEVRGRYYDDPDGRTGIDWTHHSEPTASWPQTGYVIINGGPPAS